MRVKHLCLVVGIFLVLFASGCSDQKKSDDEAARKAAAEDIFNYIPAHSPYVFGNVTPLPAPYLNKVLATWKKILPDQIKQLEKITAPAEGISGDRPEFRLINLGRALLTEMAAIKTPGDFLQQWGISPEATGTVYGLGLLPAIRLQIADKQKVEQLLTRLGEKSGQKMSTANVDGHSYRIIDVKDEVHLKVVLSVTDNYLIAGLVPGEQAAFDTFLPLLLGLKKPETPLSRPEFTAKLSQYSYPGYGDGYIDMQSIAAVLRGEGNGLNDKSFKALVPVPDFKSQIGCNVEFNRSLFKNIPKIVFGIKTLTENTIDMEMAFVLGPGVIEIIKKLPQPIPDIASQTDPMFALGLGANIPELRNAIQQLLQYIIENNQDCPDMDTDRLKGVMPKLNLALNPMISGLHSLIFSLDHIQTGSNDEPAMDTAHACIAADMNDPQGIVAMGGAFIPALAKLNIKRDGTPVAVPLTGLPVKLPKLFVAIKDKRLALAVGTGADQRVKEAVAGEGISGQPLYWMKYQVSAGDPLLKSGLSAAGKMKKNDQKAAFEAIKQYQELIKSITLALYVTDNGLSFREVVVLN